MPLLRRAKPPAGSLTSSPDSVIPTPLASTPWDPSPALPPSAETEVLPRGGRGAAARALRRCCASATTAAGSSSSASEAPATIVGSAGRSLRRRSSEDSPVGTSRRLWPQLWAQGQRSSPTLARPSTSPHAQRQSNHATPVGEPQRAVPAPGSFGALQPAGVTPAMLRVASHDDVDDLTRGLPPPGRLGAPEGGGRSGLEDDPRLSEHESETALAPPLRVNVVHPSPKQVGAAAIDAFAGPMRVSPRLSANPYATKSLILSPPASTTAASALDAASLTGATGQPQG